MATKIELSRLTRAREMCERAKALARNARRAEAELAAMLLEIEREGAHRATPTEPRRQQTQRIVSRTVASVDIRSRRGWSFGESFSVR